MELGLTLAPHQEATVTSHFLLYDLKFNSALIDLFSVIKEEETTDEDAKRKSSTGGKNTTYLKKKKEFFLF